MAWGNTGKALEVIDMILDSAQLVQIVPRLYKRYVKGEPEGEEGSDGKQTEKDGKPGVVLDKKISSLTTGFTRSDEMRLLGDMSHMVTGSKITVKDAYKVSSFLYKGGKKLRERFRDTYISDEDPEMRYSVIKVLALLPNDEQRRIFISGPGVTDPSQVEEILEQLQKPLQALGDFAREDLPELELGHIERQRQKIIADSNAVEPKHKPGSWRSSWRNFWRIKIL